eukprot:TRINITY_DN1645_c0_g1_i2.p1 TRINITY_DN1645_c0_g1~~TRINITY_DN1645_c0_g1_i2.p1  ORF type:complete len:488 (-),score=66.28 TRINITY_DN1645_c0_g1_i2:227-1690(-)
MFSQLLPSCRRFHAHHISMRAARPVKQWSFLSCWQLPIRSFADNHSGVKPSVFRIHSGDFVTSTLPRHEAIAEIRIHGINMSKRSARIVENVSRRDTISAIHLRNGYILMKLEYIKCVVLPNRLYLFDAQIPLVHDFAHRIHQALQAGGDEHLSFLLRCIDIALESVTTDYERRLTVFQPVLNAVLTSCGVGAHQTSHPALLRLLPLQNALTNFSVSLNEFLSAVRDLSHSDPVLWESLMPGNFPEVKLIADSYVKITEELANEVLQYQRRIDATRETIEVALDIQRNNILNLNVHISIAALAIGSTAAVASVFGMNLINHLETHPHAFVSVVAGITSLGGAAYALLCRFFYKKLKAPRSVQATIASSDFYSRLNDQPFINALHSSTSKEDWSRVLQLAVGKQLRSSYAAEALQNHRQRFPTHTMVGYEHYDLNGDGFITMDEVEQAEGFFGEDLRPEEIDRLMVEVAHLSNAAPTPDPTSDDPHPV